MTALDPRKDWKICIELKGDGERKNVAGIIIIRATPMYSVFSLCVMWGSVFYSSYFMESSQFHRRSKTSMLMRRLGIRKAQYSVLGTKGQRGGNFAWCQDYSCTVRRCGSVGVNEGKKEKVGRTFFQVWDWEQAVLFLTVLEDSSIIVSSIGSLRWNASFHSWEYLRVNIHPRPEDGALFSS